jgi:hypothetical protein
MNGRKQGVSGQAGERGDAWRRLSGPPTPDGRKFVLVVVAALLLVALWALEILLLGAGGTGAADAGGRSAERADGGRGSSAAPPTDGRDKRETAGRDLSLGGRAQEEGARDGEQRPEVRAVDAPEVQDPAGTGARPGGLSDTQEGRILQAASQYVVYAYGYTGDDVAAYRSGVNLAVVPGEFYRSPGAVYVEDFERRVRSGGTESTAVLESFELERASAEAATGVAYFTISDASGEHLFSQELEVVRLDAIWRVASAGDMEEV